MIRLHSCLFEFDPVLDLVFPVVYFVSLIRQDLACTHVQRLQYIQNQVWLNTEVIKLIDSKLKRKSLCVHRELPSEAEGAAGQSGWTGADWRWRGVCGLSAPWQEP